MVIEIISVLICFTLFQINGVSFFSRFSHFTFQVIYLHDSNLKFRGKWVEIYFLCKYPNIKLPVFSLYLIPPPNLENCIAEQKDFSLKLSPHNPTTTLSLSQYSQKKICVLMILKEVCIIT